LIGLALLAGGVWLDPGIVQELPAPLGDVALRLASLARPTPSQAAAPDAAKLEALMRALGTLEPFRLKIQVNSAGGAPLGDKVIDCEGVGRDCKAIIPIGQEHSIKVILLRVSSSGRLVFKAECGFFTEAGSGELKNAKGSKVTAVLRENVPGAKIGTGPVAYSVELERL
jgi:hypothetical protein